MSEVGYAFLDPEGNIRLRNRPDLETLKDYCLSVGVDIVLIFSRGGTSPDSHCRTRVFAPTFGYLEDPATGSGNSALGYYLRKAGLWETDALKIEQNDEPRAYNVVKLRTGRDSSGEERVIFGGPAITRFSGTYHLGAC